MEILIWFIIYALNQIYQLDKSFQTCPQLTPPIGSYMNFKSCQEHSITTLTKKNLKFCCTSACGFLDVIILSHIRGILVCVDSLRMCHSEREDMFFHMLCTKVRNRYSWIHDRLSFDLFPIYDSSIRIF